MVNPHPITAAVHTALDVKDSDYINTRLRGATAIVDVCRCVSYEDAQADAAGLGAGSIFEALFVAKTMMEEITEKLEEARK